jgi:hypothetical protein
MSHRRDAQLCDFRVCRMNPGDSGKKFGYSGKSGESGFFNPGVSGFYTEALIHNAAQIDHPNSEIM